MDRISPPTTKPLIPIVIVHYFPMMATGLGQLLTDTKKFNVIYRGSEIPTDLKYNWSSAVLLISVKKGWQSRFRLVETFSSVVFISGTAEFDKKAEGFRIISENATPELLVEACLELDFV